MAKKDLDADYSLDDIDFEDFGDDDFGDFNSMNKPKSARQAAVDFGGSFVGGMGQEFLNPSTQRRIIAKAMPPGFAQGHDAITAAMGSADELMGEVNRGMGDLMKTTKSSVNAILPQLESVLPQKILEGLKGWSKPSDFQYSHRNDEEDAISGHLTDLSKTLADIQTQQVEREKRQRLQSDSISIANNAVTGKLLEQQNEHLLSMRKLLNRTVAGQEQVAFKFHQKSLEIQYRTYFATRKLSDTADKTLALQEAAFKDLIHNTGLPDVVKIKNNEIASQMLKERAFTAVMSASKDTFKRVGQRIVQQAKPKIKDFFKDSNAAIGDITGLMDMAGGGDDLGISPAEMMAEMLGNFAAGKMGEKVAGKLKDKLGGNEELSRHGLAIINLLANQESYLGDAMNSGYGSGNKLTDFIRDHLGGDVFFQDKGARTVRNSRKSEDLDEHASLRWRTVNTIEEIIPGWLQMLHNEMQMMRTGDNTLRPHHWNTSKGAFETEAKTKQRLKEIVRDNVADESELAGDVLNAVDGDKKLSKGAREKMMQYIVKNRRNKHKQLNLKDIAIGNTDMGLTSDEMDEVMQLVQDMEGGGWYGDRSTIQDRIKDDYNSSLAYQQHKAKLDLAHNRLHSGFKDQDTEIQDAIQNGQGGLLEELGLITYNEDGSISTNEDKRIERITKRGTKYLARGGSTGPGSKFERKGIVHANEFVVRSESAQQPGAKQFLDAFNHKGMGALQGYRTGGMVGRPKDYKTVDSKNSGVGDALIDAIRDNNPGQALQEANEKLEGILSLTGELVKNGITQMGGSNGILETAASKGLGFAKWLGKSTISWNKWLMPKTWSAVKGGAGAAKGLVVGNMKKAQLGGVGKDDIAIDIYTRGSNTPVITKRGLSEGKYFDVASKKVIRSLKDITGDVMDDAGNVILTAADIAEGLYMADGRDVRKVWSGLFSKLKGLAGFSITATLKSWKAQLNIMGRVKDRIKRAWNIMPDIYVKGEENPRLLARLLNSGKYLVKRNSKPVSSLGDIDGEIVDMDGNTVITMEDIQKGLITKDGDDVTTRGARMLKGVKKVLGGAKKFIKGAFTFAKNAVSTGWDASMQVLGGVRDLFFGGGITTIGNKNKNVLFQIRDILDSRLNKPASSGGVFGDQDGDGDRDNGVKDILERRAKAKAEKGDKVVGHEKEEKKKGGWGLLTMLSGLGGMISGIYKTLTGGIGSMIGWLRKIALAKSVMQGADALSDMADGKRGRKGRRGRRGRLGGLGRSAGRAGAAAGRGGTLTRVGSSLARGPGWAKVAGGAALAGGTYLAMRDGEGEVDENGEPVGIARSMFNGMTDGGTTDGIASLGASTAISTAAVAAGTGVVGGLMAGGGLAGAGMGALAVLGGPVTLGVIAAGAAVWAGAKLYKKFTSTDGELTKFRMVQYGFSGEDEERAGKLLQLEKLMMGQVSLGSNGEVKIKNGVKAKEVVAIFGISSEKEILSLNHWLVHRFRPIFDLWAKSYAGLKAKGKFNEADTRLDRKGKVELLKLVHGPSSNVYNVNSSPFSAPPTAAYLGNDVDNVYKHTMVSIEKGPQGRTPSVGQKISEGLSSAYESVAAGAAKVWGSIKSGASAAWEGAKNIGGKIIGGVGSALSAAGGAIADGASAVGNLAVRGAKAYANQVGQNLSTIGNAAKTGASAVASAAGGAWDFVGRAAMGGYNAVKGAASTVGNTIGSAMSDTVGIFAGSGGSVGNIPQATGKGWGAVKDTILGAAKMVGVDPALMAGVAAVESGFNPAAKAGTSSASGLFQFIGSTWKAMIAKYGKTYGIPANASPLDARVNAVLGAAYIRENAQVVRGIKGSVNPADVYMAHFLGSGGVKTFLNAMKSNPQQAAASIMPAAAKANKSIFYDGNRPRTLAEVYQMMQNKLSTRATQFGVDLKNLGSSSGAPAAATPDKGKSPPPGIAKPAAAGAAAAGTNVPKTSAGIPLTLAKPGSTAAPATGVPALQKQADQIVGNAKTNVATGNTAGVSSNASPTSPDKLKRLLASATDELVNLGKKACTTQSGVNVARVNSDFMRLFYAMIGEWVKKGYGNSIVITSGFRDSEKQRILYENYKRTKKPPMAAAPGRSKHEFGIALDINSANANSLASSGCLAKWAFFRPLLNHKSFPEPWHLEHAYFTKSGASTAKEVVKTGAAPASSPSTPSRVERNIKGGTITGIIDPTDSQIKPITDAVTSGATTTAPAADGSKDTAKAASAADKVTTTAVVGKAVPTNFAKPESGSTKTQSHEFNAANPQLSPQQIEADKQKLATAKGNTTVVDTVKLPSTASARQRNEAQAAVASDGDMNKYFERTIAIQTSMDSTLKSMLTELRGVNKGQQGVAKGLLAQAEATLAGGKTGTPPPAPNSTPNNTRDPISLQA